MHAEEEKALHKALKLSLVENTAEDDLEELEEIEEMKTFHPTEAEWEDPITYIENLHYNEDAAQYGCVKIIPPESFRPMFKINMHSE